MYDSAKVFGTHVLCAEVDRDRRLGRRGTRQKRNFWGTEHRMKIEDYALMETCRRPRSLVVTVPSTSHLALIQAAGYIDQANRKHGRADGRPARTFSPAISRPSR